MRVVCFRDTFAQQPVAAEAAAVAMVKARGGVVTFSGSGHVLKVDLADRPTTDADLSRLESLEQIESLEVWGAEINDAGMKTLSRLKSLKSLVLENTNITDLALRN